jgi:hypothetical protein
MTGYMNHPSKMAIREYWCKPLLRFIHENLGYKLTYLGLPAAEAYDILCWLDYISYVIAFQCRDYPNPSSVEQPKGDVEKLEIKLLELERKGKIESFALYDGYMEEILIKGKDTVGKVFSQDRTVNIYNLDFCNSIAVPLRYHDTNGDECEAYKPEAIRKLLNLQRESLIGSHVGKFVMFLTVHSTFIPAEEERFLRQNQEPEFKTYLSKVNKLPALERDLRILKTYVYQIVKNFFCAMEFSPEFLPAIYYQGARSHGRENWLVHFTIIGVHNRNPSAIATCLQPTAAFLDQKFLNINNNRFCSRNTPGIIENNANGNSDNAFSNSQVFTELWQL